jgi:hypothetical protein
VIAGLAMDEIQELRKEIGKLYEKRRLGDLTEKRFQAHLANRTVDLYRALVAKRMRPGEAIAAEHHAVFSHFKLMQSILKEPEQKAVSLFATGDRLYRVQASLNPDKPPRGDKCDHTVVDELPISRIGFFRVRRQIRWGEMAVGAAFAALAIIFQPLLEITGHVLAGLGILGILHGFLLPTRWLEIGPAGGANQQEPILVHALRKKSARKLVGFLREKVRDGKAAQGASG